MSIKIADAYISITADEASLNGVLGGIQGNVSAWNVAVGNLVADAIKGVIGLVESAAGAMVGFLTDSINKAADFQQKMADVKAVMGLTADETKRLSDLAINLGLDPKLKVTTLEAADAIQVLGKQGLEVTDIMGGAARATVVLSNATGGDMKTSATIAAQAMRIFGINASDLGHVVNSITGVVNNSKFSLNDYRLALSQGGNAAKAAGISFEDFNTFLVANQDAFSSGSNAGTNFRVMIQRLVPQSNQAADSMRQLGLLTGSSAKEANAASDSFNKINQKIAELDPTSKNYEAQLKKLRTEQIALAASTVAGSNAFFDAQGNTKSMSDITQLLSDKLSGLSDKQRIEALNTIFGYRAMQTATEVASGTGLSFDKLSKLINITTDAFKSAEDRMGTFRGAAEILHGVIDAIQISFGLPMLDALSRFDLALGQVFGTDKTKPILDFFTNLSNYIISLIDNALTPMAQKWLPIIIDHLILLGNALLGAAPSVTVAKNALDVLGAKIVELIDWVRELIPQVRDFVTWLQQTYDKVKALVGPIIEVIAKFISWKDVLLAIGVVLTPLMLALADLILKLAAIAVAVGVLRKAWESDWAGMRSYTVQVLEELTKTIDFWLSDTTDKFGTDTEAWKRVMADAFTYIEGKVKLLLAVISGLVSAVLALARGDWVQAWEIVKKAAKDAVESNTKAFDAGLDALNIMFVNKAPPIGKKLPDGLAAGIDSGKGAALKAVDAVGQGTIDNWQRKLESHSPSQVFFREGMNIIQGIINGLNSGVANLISIATGIAGQVTGAIRGAFDAAMGGLAGIGSAIAGGIAGGISAGTGSVTQAAVDVVNAAKQAAGATAQVKSPSKLFAREVGLPIAQGIGVGIMDGLRDMGRNVGLGVKGLIPSIGGALGGSNSGAGGLDFRNVVSLLGGISNKLGIPGGVTVQQNFYFQGSANSSTVKMAAESGARDALRQVGLR